MDAVAGCDCGVSFFLKTLYVPGIALSCVRLVRAVPCRGKVLRAALVPRMGKGSLHTAPSPCDAPSTPTGLFALHTSSCPPWGPLPGLSQSLCLAESHLLVMEWGEFGAGWLEVWWCPSAMPLARVQPRGAFSGVSWLLNTAPATLLSLSANLCPCHLGQVLGLQAAARAGKARVYRCMLPLPTPTLRACRPLKLCPHCLCLRFQGLWNKVHWLGQAEPRERGRLAAF